MLPEMAIFKIFTAMYCTVLIDNLHLMLVHDCSGYGSKSLTNVFTFHIVTWEPCISISELQEI